MPLLNADHVRRSVNKYFQNYLIELKIKCIALNSNSDHIHFLIELPTDRTIEDIVKLLKGSSSHWINQSNLIISKLAWAVGYAVFTVSKSNIGKLMLYIINQKEHHKKLSFQEEYNRFLEHTDNFWKLAAKNR